MSSPKTPAKSEKERRAEALQKALRDNLRRRKAAAATPEPGDTPDQQTVTPDKAD